MLDQKYFPRVISISLYFPSKPSLHHTPTTSVVRIARLYRSQTYKMYFTSVSEGEVEVDTVEEEEQLET